MSKPRIDAKLLAKKWGLNVRHALYRKTGNWYHRLTKFPGALLDDAGYVVFETEDAFVNCLQLRIKKDVGVRHAGTSIRDIPGYVFHVAEPKSSRYEPLDDDADMSALENTVRLAMRRHRTRERRLRDAKIAEALRLHGRLRCEVPKCGFDFQHAYGALGAGYAQVHHLQPLSSGAEPVTTRLAELAVVCANCHAMIHRGGACRALDDLIPHE